jgi:ABC-type nitrate/sulfonate/bicarbonate transport system substrate-binding protein
MGPASEGRKSARIIYGALGGGSAPVWAAYEAGLFDRNGIDVDLALVRGMRAVTDELLSGKAQFANIASSGPLKVSLQGGRDLVYLTGGLNYMVQSVVTQPRISSGRDLKGKRLGGSGEPSGVESVLMVELGSRLGLDLERALVHVPIKDQPDALAKLERDEIDAALFTPPWLFEAKRRGFRILVDAQELKLDCQLGGIVCTKELVAQDPDLIRRVVKSYVEGVHRFRTDVAFAIDLQKKYSKVADRAVALECHALYSTYFKQRPYPSAKGIKMVLGALSREIPGAASVDPERFIDRRWLQALDESGFIDALYSGEERDS